MSLRGHISYVPKGAFSVNMAELDTAVRNILRHWRAAKYPRVKEWANAVVEAASYESRLGLVKEQQ